jgi:hypothetical protein
MLAWLIAVLLSLTQTVINLLPCPKHIRFDKKGMPAVVPAPL